MCKELAAGWWIILWDTFADFSSQKRIKIFQFLVNKKIDNQKLNFAENFTVRNFFIFNAKKVGHKNFLKNKEKK